MSEIDTENLEDGFGGTYSDRKYEDGQFPKGGAPGSFVHRPVAHAKFGNKNDRGGGKYWKTHFGWKGRNGEGKLVYRPIVCIEEKRDGMITQDCPLCKLRQPYLDKLEKIKAIGKAKNKSPDEIKRASAPVKEWLRDHGLDGKVRIPGYNQKGTPQVAKVGYGVYKSYLDECRRLQGRNIDACGPEGVLFEFTRSKQASFDSDSCQVLRDDDDRMVRANLNKDLAKLLFDSLPNLDEMKKKDTYSYDQLEQLAALTRETDGSYDPEEVDRILGITNKGTGGGKSGGAAAEDDDWAADEGKKDEKPAAAKSKAKAEPPKEEASAEDDEFADEEPAKAEPPKKTETKSKSEKSEKKAPKEEPADDEDYDAMFK